MKTWTLDIKTISEANNCDHWRVKHKRHQSQKSCIRLWSIENNIQGTSLPCVVRLTRLAPRTLDADDNLRMSFKWIKDYIADEMLPGQAAGRADSDTRIKWEYAQEKSSIYAIRIEVISDSSHNIAYIGNGDIQ